MPVRIPERKQFEIRYNGKTLHLGRKTAIMGILNITPDSFSDGGLYLRPSFAVKKAEQLLKEGADIIDIGGESTRPGSFPISKTSEANRVVPVIRRIRKDLGHDFFISIDTYKADVARQALENGADIVNSLSGFELDRKITVVVKDFRCPVIMYHIRGVPRTMQSNPYYKDVVKDVMTYFRAQINVAKSEGVYENQLLIDPGIGFGKSTRDNLRLLRKLDLFSSLGRPLVVGVSRKRHLGSVLKSALQLKALPSESDRLEAALAETSMAVYNGANIIRTHDVLQTKKFTAVIDNLLQIRG